MGLWKDLLRLLGLTSDARVHISAPGIDVVITGEPEQVRSLLSVVKYELERSTRWRDRDQKKLRPGSRRNTPNYVQPTELDEMDSPYALPEALVMPVDEITDERDRQPASRKASEHPRAAAEVRVEGRSAPYALEPATLLPEMRMDARPRVVRTESPPQEVASTKIDSNPPPSLESQDIDGPEREVTALLPNPSGPHPAQDPPELAKSERPFVTDGGLTLTPELSDSDINLLTPPLKKDRRPDTDPDDTKETPRKSS